MYNYQIIEDIYKDKKLIKTVRILFDHRGEPEFEQTRWIPTETIMFRGQIHEQGEDLVFPYLKRLD